MAFSGSHGRGAEGPDGQSAQLSIPEFHLVFISFGVSCNLQSPGVGYCNLLLKLLSLSLDWVKLRVWPWATPINPEH